VARISEVASLLGRLDDVIELDCRADELLIELHRGLDDLRDLAACAGNGLAHVDELGKHAAGRCLPLRLEHGRFELGDGLEPHLGLGRAIAAGILGKKAAPAHNGHERVFDCRIIVGKRSALNFRWRGEGAVFGAFRHGLRLA
jgi:hypothetical protein